MFGINYDGLRKKKTYDELIDYVMNKQEKIQYPDRTAKFLSNIPQLSNLLDGNGEGLLEMEEQQKRQMMEVEKEHRLREMAGPSAGSATEMKTKTRTFFTQTMVKKTGEQGNQTNNPKIATTGSQAWRPNIASVHSQAVPEMNNMETQSWKDITSVYSQTVPKTEDRGNQTKKKTMVNTGTDAGNATIFDMTSNDEFDVDMTDAINQQENAKKKKII